MALYRSLLEPFCDEPILGLAYLFARGTFYDAGLRALSDNAPIPGPPELPGAIADKSRAGHIERAGSETQALCAVTETTIVAVGVEPARAALGLSPDFWNLTLDTDPLILRRATTDVVIKRRIVSKVIIFTDRTTLTRYEFEVHVFGTGNFNDPFFAALAP